MRAGIYCRVSTEHQEEEGTSLQSQLEACKRLAQERGYEVPEGFVAMETYSGLSLERPRLDEVRQWVRNGEVDVVIAYTLDRLSRNPVHFIILQEEMQRFEVEVVLVTDDLDSTDMGVLITHIKGYAAKLEAEKIRERTMRGIKERVKAGKLPSGRRGRLYGYTYIPGKDEGQGIRLVNEDESKWVDKMFRWLVDEGLTLNGITYRLRELGVPTPSGKGHWIRSTVHKILKNPAYTGKTCCFTHVHKETNKHCKDGRKSRKTSITIKPYEEGVEIPGATPAIISDQLFNKAQAKLRANKSQSNRNGKVKYLLRGHIYCARCNRKYWGYSRWLNGEPDVSNQRYYYCMGRRAIITPNKCDNKGCQADRLEDLVWEQIEEVLSNPQAILAELEKRRHEPSQAGLLEEELDDVTRRLRELDKEQERLLQWALKGFPEETVARENEKINRERIELKKRRTDLGKRIGEAEQNEIDLDGVERFCEMARHNLPNLTHEDKRLALEELGVKVWIDGDSISIHGYIPVMAGATESTPARWNHPRRCRSER